MAKRKDKQQSSETDKNLAMPDPENIATDLVVRCKPFILPLIGILALAIIIAVVREQMARKDNLADAHAYSSLDQALKEFETITSRRDMLQQERFQIESRIEQLASMFGGRDNQFIQQTIQQAAGIDRELAEEEAAYQKELSGLAARLQSVIDEFPDSGAAIDARFFLATTAYRKDEFESAAAAFTAFHETFRNHEPLTSMARLSAIDATMAAGNFEDAIALAMAASSPGNLSTEELRVQANLKAAFCAALSGNYTTARQQIAAIEAAKAGSESLKIRADQLKSLLDILSPDEFRQLATSLPTKQTSTPAATPDETIAPNQTPAAE